METPNQNQQQINVNELFAVIGKKSVEIEMLTGNFIAAQNRINELEAELREVTIAKHDVDETNIPK
jgi:hypothetical protein